MQAPIELPRHVPLVVATRGDAVESVHYGSLAVADAAGRLLCGIGDTDFPVFTRSTLKPFQALPFAAAGGPAHFGFSPAQVALMCASHSGEARHVEAVADMLARIGCGEGDLQCGCHLPVYYSATGRTPPPDPALSPLQHNCSGKHAGFLAWCRQHDQPIAGYLDPAHPLQREIRRCVARLAGCAEEEMPMGTDGCSAPNLALPLAGLARAYARLAAPSPPDEQGAALAALFQAMAAYPEMVSGEARGDLRLIQAGAGDWVAKAGAEGMQALAIRSRGLGIALKIADGSPRAAQVAIDAAIGQLGLLPPGNGGLPRAVEIRNYAGRVTGRLMPVFRLG